MNNSTSTINLNSQEGSFLVLYAFRYAIGRRTYAADEVSDFIKANFNFLDSSIQNLIIKEIKLEIEHNNRLKLSENLTPIDMKCWIRTLEDITDPSFTQLEIPLVLN